MTLCTAWSPGYLPLFSYPWRERGAGICALSKSRGNLKSEKSHQDLQNSRYPRSSSGRRDQPAALKPEDESPRFFARGLPEAEFLPYKPLYTKDSAPVRIGFIMLQACRLSSLPRHRASPSILSNQPGHRRSLPYRHRGPNSTLVTQAAPRLRE